MNKEEMINKIAQDYINNGWDLINNNSLSDNFNDSRYYAEAIKGTFGGDSDEIRLQIEQETLKLWRKNR